MNRIVLSILVLALFVTSGCAVQRVKKSEAFPEMYNEKPIAILVIPALNQSTAADAPDLYSSTIAEPLANSGYYVLPIEVTDKFLKSEGFSSGEQLMDVPPEKFAEPFGADAVLYVQIEKWDTNYFVTGGNVTVGVSLMMKSTKTGESLWSYRDEQKINTGGDSGGGLLAAIIATAITTSMQDYVSIARTVNVRALSAVPFGKYHANHGKDGMSMVVAKKAGKEKAEPQNTVAESSE